MEEITIFNKRRTFNKTVVPGKKKSKVINVGPMLISDYRVGLQQNLFCWHLFDNKTVNKM